MPRYKGCVNTYKGKTVNREQAMEKVRKLLALAESENENEAAAAMGRAQAIMAKFQIETASLEIEPEESEGPIETWDDPLDVSSATWRRHLARVLCDANGCFVFRSGKETRITGRAGAVSTVRYLFDFCCREIDRLAREHGGNGRTWLNNYRLGCVDAVRAAVKEAKDRARSEAYEAAGGGSELVVVDRALARIDEEAKAVEDYVRSRVQLSAASGSSYQRNASARAQGARDGRNIYSGGSRKSVGGGRRAIGG